MSKGYWLVRVDIDDNEAYKKYTSANGPVLGEFGARFLVRAGRAKTVEGSARQRNAVIEFPSYEAALACWQSPEYQELMKLRTAVSQADIVVIEGYDGSQPAKER